MVTGTTITLDLALVTLDQQGLLRAPAYIAGANRLAVGDMATVSCPATAQGPSCRSGADSSNRGEAALARRAARRDQLHALAKGQHYRRVAGRRRGSASRRAVRSASRQPVASSSSLSAVRQLRMVLTVRSLESNQAFVNLVRDSPRGQ